jgi:hypothetical protein
MRVRLEVFVWVQLSCADWLMQYTVPVASVTFVPMDDHVMAGGGRMQMLPTRLGACTAASCVQLQGLVCSPFNKDTGRAHLRCHLRAWCQDYE